jgi:hypothetical protein
MPLVGKALEKRIDGIMPTTSERSPHKLEGLYLLLVHLVISSDWPACIFDPITAAILDIMPIVARSLAPI